MDFRDIPYANGKKKRYITVFKDIPYSDSKLQAEIRWNKILLTGDPCKRSLLYKYVEASPHLDEVVKPKLVKVGTDNINIIDPKVTSIYELLLGRVTDMVIDCYNRSLLPGNEMPIIGATFKRQTTPGTLDWYIIIRTRFPEWYIDFLPKYKEWVAIDIELEDLSMFSKKEVELTY